MKNKVVIVTGSSSGIGEATAKAFAKQGARVVVNSRSNPESGERIVAEIIKQGGEAVHIQADVGIYKEANRLVTETVSSLGV